MQSADPYPFAVTGSDAESYADFISEVRAGLRYLLTVSAADYDTLVHFTPHVRVVEWPSMRVAQDNPSSDCHCGTDGSEC